MSPGFHSDLECLYILTVFELILHITIIITITIVTYLIETNERDNLFHKMQQDSQTFNVAKLESKKGHPKESQIHLNHLKEMGNIAINRLSERSFQAKRNKNSLKRSNT